MDINVIKAQSRQDKGKGASRRLRREGTIPGIVYGGGKDALSVTLSHNQIWHAAAKETFFSQIFDLNVDGKVEKVVVKAMQRHPYKPLIAHIDFLRVSADQVLRTSIPIQFINEDSCIGVKDGGMITRDLNEVEISCLPKDLPDFIQVDVAQLNIGESIHLSKIEVPEGVEFIDLVRGNDQSVVSVIKIRVADEKTATEDEGAEESGEEE